MLNWLAVALFRHVLYTLHTHVFEVLHSGQSLPTCNMAISPLALNLEHIFVWSVKLVCFGL